MWVGSKCSQNGDRCERAEAAMAQDQPVRAERWKSGKLKVLECYFSSLCCNLQTWRRYEKAYTLFIYLFPVLTALPSVTATGVQRCGWALYEWAERQVYITSYSPRGDANHTYSTIAIHWYFSLHVWLCSWDYCMSSIVATTLKIALHRWINHRVRHEITGSVASCAVCRAYIMHMLHK